MTSDYLKQLQLTKQLEQRAKEAARNRKAAEEKLGEAEKALAAAKEVKADTVEAEKFLTEGTHAYSKHDYPTALSLAVKCLDKLAEGKRAQVKAILGSAEAVLSLVPGEEGKEEVRAQFARAEELAASSRPDDALAAAKQAWDKADQFSNRRLAESFGRVQTLILLAEHLGLAVAARKQALAKARKLQEDGDREGAWEKTTTCMDGLRDAFARLFQARSGRLSELIAEASKAGADLAVISEALEKGRAALDRGGFEDALDHLGMAEEKLSEELARAVKLRLGALSERAQHAREVDADLASFDIAVKKAGDLAEEGRGEDALQGLSQAEAALRRSEAEAVLGHIEQMRPGLQLARRLNLDISDVLEDLEKARRTVADGDLNSALDRVDEAEGRLREHLGRYDQLGRELESTKKLFTQARRLGVRLGEASEFVAAARQDAISGSPEQALEKVHKAQAEVQGRVREACAQDVLKGLFMVSQALAMGASVEEEERELEGISDLLRKGVLEDVPGRLVKVGERLRGIVHGKASNKVRAVRERLARSSGRVELKDLRAPAEEAESLLARGELLRAYWSAADVDEEARRRQAAVLEELTVTANRLLEVGRELGAESKTLNQKLASAAASTTDPGETVRVLSEVIQFARTLIKDELTRSLAQLNRAEASARKKGVATANSERLAEEALRALERNEMERCHALLRESEAELEKVTALHTEVYDQIVSISRVLDEVRLPSGSKVHALLQETKSLFESGKYDGARVSAKACYAEMEEVAAATLAPRRQQEARQLIVLMAQLGMDTSTLEDAVKRSETLMNKGRHGEALGLVKDAHRNAAGSINSYLVGTIASTKALLERCRAMGADVASPTEIVAKSEALLREGRYTDAHRAVRFAATEGERTLSQVRSVLAEVERAEAALDEAADLEIEVLEAMDVLAQAKHNLHTGRFPLAMERARMVVVMAREAAQSVLAHELEELSADHDLARLAGEDLSRVRTDRDKVIATLDKRGATAAFAALEEYERRVAQVSGWHTSALDALERGRGELSGTPLASVLEEADRAFARGAFREARSVVLRALAEGAVLRSQAQRRSEALAGVRTRAESEGSGSVISELTTAEASGDFWSLLSSAEAKLRRFRDDRRLESLVGMIDALRCLTALMPEELLPVTARELLPKKVADLTTADLTRGEELRALAAEEVRRSASMTQHDGEAARAALHNALKLVESGDLSEAAWFIQEAGRCGGWTAQGREGMWDRYHQVAADLDSHTYCVDAKALRSRLSEATALPPEQANGAIEQVAATLLTARSAGVPSVRMRLDTSNGETVLRLTNEGGPAYRLRLEGAEAADLPPTLHRTAEVRLGSLPSKLRLTYRGLFSPPTHSELDA